MVMRVIIRVHADDCSWWTGVGKHADEDQICVVNPIKVLVQGNVESSFVQQGEYSRRILKIWAEGVVDIFGGVYVCYG